MKYNIAIDGPSAAGKSTIAKLLAKQMNYIHLDTGAMYRCVAFMALQENLDLQDEEGIAHLIDYISISFSDNGVVLLNGIDVSSQIRSNEVSMATAQISSLPQVRAKLVKMQQEIAKDKGYILDGRDIGSVVLPDAELKIYMIASVEARAKRRYQEYVSKGITVDYEKIYEDIEKRDYLDMNRAISPLQKCADAYEIDTSDLSIEAVVKKIQEKIQQMK